MDEGLAEAYSRLISAGKLQSDREQEQAVGTLDTLYEELKVAKQFSLRKASLLSRLRFRSHPSVPKGIYLFGGVGRGKTMLMDLFYGVVSARSKRRVHFCVCIVRIGSQRLEVVLVMAHHGIFSQSKMMRSNLTRHFYSVCFRRSD